MKQRRETPSPWISCKRKVVRERKQQHPLMESNDSVPRVPSNDTFTAWEKKPSLKEKQEKSKVHHPNFSRLLGENEDNPSAQKKTVPTMATLDEEQENLSLSLSLQEQTGGHDNVVPVNFSVPENHHPEQITSVETVEPEPQTLKDQVPSFSRLLGENEEHPTAQKKTVPTMEALVEEQEPLSPSLSLQEQTGGQNNVVPVNFFVPENHHPEQIISVETVEPEPQTLRDQVPSTSRRVENLPILPTYPSPGPKKEDVAQPQFHRGATFHGIHSKLPEDSGSASSFSTETGMCTAIWSMGQRISHWRSAHQRGYHLDQLTHDKFQRQAIRNHERDSKETVPLPLQEVIEEEVLEILKETQKSYQRKLGTKHQLTLQLEKQVEKLYLRLKGRGVID